MNILDKIIQHKKKEIIDKALKKPVNKLEKSSYFNRKTLALTEALLNNEKTGIIAEFKRKSPSKGILNDEATVEEVITGYFRGGASALSILTDSAFFGGSVQDLLRARELASIPILRKDFIIDEYQIIESKAIGADAILLIAAALGKNQLKKLARLAVSLNLQIILEIHESPELIMATPDISVIGVNNRNLKDFNVDINCSLELARLIPPGFIKISESGIHSVDTIKRLKLAGYQGFLVGEQFMHQPDPALAFMSFVKQLY
jgi:indole-3-glycerol phosphate synthase